MAAESTRLGLERENYIFNLQILGRSGLHVRGGFFFPEWIFTNNKRSTKQWPVRWKLPPHTKRGTLLARRGELKVTKQACWARKYAAFFFFKWRQTKRCCFCRASYKTTNWPLMSPWMAKYVFAAIKFCFCEDEMAETGTKKYMFLKISPLTLILGSLLLEMTVYVTSCVRRKVAEHGRWVESQTLSV